MTPATELVPGATLSSSEGWYVCTVPEIGSTNTAASRLPGWHAVRAGVQTAGRGRTGRPWVSDEGGLWLSAVVPCPGNRARWSILPLAAGWAIVAALHERGARGLRLRWPNDIMAGSRKLAGILVERFDADSAVIGLGLNVGNSPEESDPVLAGATARLADLVPGPHSLDDLTRLILRSIGHAHALICRDEFRQIADDLNRQWSQPRRVAVTLAGCAQPFTGSFTGVDEAGRLRVTTERRGPHAYDAAQVSLLRELE